MIYKLPKERIVFPNPLNGPKNSPLAYGGDLQVDRLLFAYKNGIFPWYNENFPLLWWSPDPRAVLFPKNFHINRNLNRSLKKYDVKINKNFDKVIRSCANIKRKEKGTWLNNQMIKAYTSLHELGFAHSVETYENGELIGGLYGLNFGNIFCGESMFSFKNNASKVALFELSRMLNKEDGFIDAQIQNPYLASLGSCEIKREEFLKRVEVALLKPDIFEPFKI